MNVHFTYFTYRLLTCFLNLLQDESEDVRSRASLEVTHLYHQVAINTHYVSHSRAELLMKSDHLHPNIALDLVRV